MLYCRRMRTLADFLLLRCKTLNIKFYYKTIYWVLSSFDITVHALYYIIRRRIRREIESENRGWNDAADDSESTNHFRPFRNFFKIFPPDFGQKIFRFFVPFHVSFHNFSVESDAPSTGKSFESVVPPESTPVKRNQFICRVIIILEINAKRLWLVRSYLNGPNPDWFSYVKNITFNSKMGHKH